MAPELPDPELPDRDLIAAADYQGLGGALAARFSPRPVVVVSNPIVAPLWAAPVLNSLRGAGFAPTLLKIPDGEASKDLDTWRGLVEALLVARVDRGTPILALGGGVTGDIVGFAAATTLRGLPFVQLPTTLLAMVDAAVGGKTGVNAGHGKNLVGAFHPPALVYANVGALSTLPAAELRCGLGEVVKHGLLADVGLLERCESGAAAILNRDSGILTELVTTSWRIKGQIVARDPLERGERALLNLGHTVGHAIESALGFGAMRHGECVALGLLAEARWAASMRFCTSDLVDRLEQVLVRLELPTEIPAHLRPLRRSALVAAAGVDKKMTRGTLTLPILHEVGRAELGTVSLADISRIFNSVSGLLED